MFRQTALSAKKKFPRVRVAAAAGRQGVFLFTEGAPGERRPFLTNGKTAVAFMLAVTVAGIV